MTRISASGNKPRWPQCV